MRSIFYHKPGDQDYMDDFLYQNLLIRGGVLMGEIPKAGPFGGFDYNPKANQLMLTSRSLVHKIKLPVYIISPLLSPSKN